MPRGTQTRSFTARISGLIEIYMTSTNADHPASADLICELVAGSWLRWRDASNHPNERACRPWAMLVRGLHSQYDFDGEWLDKRRIDGDIHFDVSELVSPQLLRISGASHNNRKHQCYRIVGTDDDTIALERLSDAEAIEAVTERDRRDELIDRITTRLPNLAVEELEEIEAVVEPGGGP